VILIELEGGGSRRYRLEFHPRVTVVVGLGSVQRRELAAAINDALSGHLHDLSISVDVGGDPQHLTPALLASLGLTGLGVDNVIEPADLPGATVLGAPQRPNVAVPRPAARTPDERLLEQASLELQRSQARAAEFAQRLELARKSSRSEDVHKLKSYLDSVRARSLELTSALRSAEEDHRHGSAGSARRTAIEHQVAQLEQRIEALRATVDAPQVDHDALRAALAAARVPYASEGVVPQDIDHLLRGLREVQDKVVRLQEQQQPPQWLLFQIKDELDDARARVTALSLQHADGIDVEDKLRRAHGRLADAQEAWNELEQGVMGQVAAAQDELDVLHAQAVVMLGGEPPIDELAERLGALRDRMTEHDDAVVRLVRELARIGVNADAATAARAAEQWIADVEAGADRSGQARRELREAEAELRDLEEHLAQLGEPEDPAGSQRTEQLGQQLQELHEIERELEARLAKARRSTGAPTDELAELERAHRNALADVTDIAGEVEELKAKLASSGSGDRASVAMPSAGDASRPWWEGDIVPAAQRSFPIAADVEVDMSSVVDSEVDQYVLAKAAALRRAGRGESIPLVIDGAFDSLSPELAERVLDVFPKIGHIVQIVYLASGDLAEKWAKRQDEMSVGVVRLQRA
jgi:chromosome segregation ATPase